MDIEKEFGEFLEGFEENPAPLRQEGIGVVVANKQLCIGLDPRDTRIIAYITCENRSEVRLGKYLIIDYPDGEQLLSRITSLEYAQQYLVDDATEIYARRTMGQEADENDYKFLASLEPIAVLYDREGLRRRMPDRIPVPNAVVKPAQDKNVVKTGLKIPRDGVFLGHLSVGGELVRTYSDPPTVDYRLINSDRWQDPLVFRHMLISGGTGSGKSFLSKNVLRQFLSTDVRYRIEENGEIVQRRPCLIVFDPQDEYSQLYEDNPGIPEDKRGRWDDEGIEYGGYEDTVTFAARVEGTRYNPRAHASVVEFSIPFELVRTNKWLIAGWDMNEAQFNALDILLDRYFREADPPRYKDFLKYIDNPALKEEYENNGRIPGATYDAMKRRVRLKDFRRVFDQPAPSILDLIPRLVRPGGVSVIPSSHLNSSRAEEIIVLAISSLLVDNKLGTNVVSEIKHTPIILAMDEAHRFLARAETEQGRRVIGKFAEAAKQGRKERLGLVLITQDPHDIAEAVFKQVNTKLVLNLGDEGAIRSLNIPSYLTKRVPYLERGQLVVYSPDNSEPVELVGLHFCVVRHGR